jgi:hypothetical protein
LVIFHAGRESNGAKLEWNKFFCFPSVVTALCPDREIIIPWIWILKYFNIHMEAKCYATEVFTGTDAQWHASVQNSRILRRP